MQLAPKRYPVLLASVAALAVGGVAAVAQLSVDGAVRAEGGFRFPDGTLQSTALELRVAMRATGQSTCWDATPTPVACAGTGQDGEHLSGIQVAEPRFVDNGDGTTTDSLTGLIWLEDAGCFEAGRWEVALSEANGLESGSCGLSDGSAPGDWRLPNVPELGALIDFGEVSPALPASHPFLGVPNANGCWTSTTYVGQPQSAWFVEIANGGIGQADKASGVQCAWPVRGGQ
jgi:Protein of unknown function (DUF1566)